MKVFSIRLSVLLPERLGLLQCLWQVVASRLREEEGQQTHHDGPATHDDEGKEGGHRVEVSDGGGQQGAHPGHGGAHPHRGVSYRSVEQFSCKYCHITTYRILSSYLLQF